MCVNVYMYKTSSEAMVHTVTVAESESQVFSSIATEQSGSSCFRAQCNSIPIDFLMFPLK